MGGRLAGLLSRGVIIRGYGAGHVRRIIRFEPLFIAGRLLMNAKTRLPARRVMGLSSTTANRRIVEFIQAARQHWDVAYAVAIGRVALAALARWVLGDYVGAQIPFVTFFPAIITATLLGGFWPGVCALIVAVVAAWYLFLPP